MINSGTGTLPGVRQRLMSHSWWKKGRAQHLGQRVFSLTRPPSCRANGPSGVCSHLLDQETSDMFWLSGSESGWLEAAGSGTNMKRCGGNLRVGLFALRPPPEKRSSRARTHEPSSRFRNLLLLRNFFPSIFRNEPKCLSLELTRNRAVGTRRGTCACERPTPARSPGGPAGDASAYCTLTE